MGGRSSFFGFSRRKSYRPPPRPVVRHAPKVRPSAPIRAEEGESPTRRRRGVSGQKTTILNGTQGVTNTGDSTSVKTLLGG